LQVLFEVRTPSPRAVAAIDSRRPACSLQSARSSITMTTIEDYRGVLVVAETLDEVGEKFWKTAGDDEQVPRPVGFRTRQARWDR